MEKLTINVEIHKDLESLWQYWINAEHITRWYRASDDLRAPSVKQSFEEESNFSIRLEDQDGNSVYNITGTYTMIDPGKKIVYRLEDHRIVITTFEVLEASVMVTQMFDLEEETTAEAQEQEWQAILDRYKQYCESQ